MQLHSATDTFQSVTTMFKNTIIGKKCVRDENSIKHPFLFITILSYRISLDLSKFLPNPLSSKQVCFPFDGSRLKLFSLSYLNEVTPSKSYDRLKRCENFTVPLYVILQTSVCQQTGNSGVY